MRTKVLLFILAALSAAGVSVAAQDLPPDLWGIRWASSPRQVRQLLEKQGFRAVDPGGASGSGWLMFEKGRFLELPCGVRTNWIGRRLEEVHVDLKERSLKNAAIYRDLAGHFQKLYGSPSRTDAFYLKIFPAVKVELMSWRVSREGKAAFEAVLTLSTPDGKAGSDIEITYIKLGDDAP